MRMIVVCVKDVAIAAFLRPFVVRHRGEAVRMFTDEVNRMDKDNPLNAHTKDFELFVLGSFDDETGGLESVSPARIAAGVDVRLSE